MDVLAIHFDQAAVDVKTTAIRAALLDQSLHLRQGNFAAIHADDLATLFQQYDRRFFDGWLTSEVACQASRPLEFRLSPTMTRAGGKLITHRLGRPGRGTTTHFQIAVASRLLFMSFDKVDRPIRVAGRLCTDRLDALQRIMEHEIIHLVERLVWDKSSCKRPRFRGLAGSIFAHTAFEHDLVTPQEHAAEQFGVRVGDIVSFKWDGRQRTGRVNRVHQRATVLVADDKGVPYSDGKRYCKFYVPLDLLETVTGR